MLWFLCYCLFGVIERLKPGCEAQIEAIEAEINCKLEKVEWLPGFYSLPPDIQIANSNAYREGKVSEERMHFFFRQQEIPNWQILIEIVRICVLFGPFRYMESMRHQELPFQP